jgi:hypothetical protein
LVIEANAIVMGDRAWYAKAKGALRQTQALVLRIPSPTASRMREHLFALSKREGGFKEIFYMVRELRFHALFFRAAAKMGLGVAMRDAEGSLDVRMHGQIADHSLRNEELLVIPSEQYRGDE